MQAEVYFVDHGDQEAVDVSALKPLTPEYLKLPFQVEP